jgi:hypothetical protein
MLEKFPATNWFPYTKLFYIKTLYVIKPNKLTQNNEDDKETFLDIPLLCRH